MKDHNIHNNPLWENKLKNNNLNREKETIQEYTQWLKRKNSSDETISRYLITINQFSERELNTDSVISFLRDGLTKYQPNTLRGQKTPSLLMRNSSKSMVRLNEILLAR